MTSHKSFSTFVFFFPIVISNCNFFVPFFPRSFQAKMLLGGIFYSVFHWFRQAKFANVRSFSSLSKFSPLSQRPLKTTLQNWLENNNLATLIEIGETDCITLFIFALPAQWHPTIGLSIYSLSFFCSRLETCQLCPSHWSLSLRLVQTLQTSNWRWPIGKKDLLYWQSKKFTFIHFWPLFIQASYFETTRGQFHQRSTCSFYVNKLRPQLFCAYVLGLYFTGVSLPVQKLCVEHWWNWA
jgi:hypothetical protein